MYYVRGYTLLRLLDTLLLLTLTTTTRLTRSAHPMGCAGSFSVHLGSVSIHHTAGLCFTTSLFVLSPFPIHISPPFGPKPHSKGKPIKPPQGQVQYPPFQHNIGQGSAHWGSPLATSLAKPGGFQFPLQIPQFQFSKPFQGWGSRKHSNFPFKFVQFPKFPPPKFVPPPICYMAPHSNFHPLFVSKGPPQILFPTQTNTTFGFSIPLFFFPKFLPNIWGTIWVPHVALPSKGAFYCGPRCLPIPGVVAAKRATLLVVGTSLNLYLAPKPYFGFGTTLNFPCHSIMGFFPTLSFPFPKLAGALPSEIPLFPDPINEPFPPNSSFSFAVFSFSWGRPFPHKVRQFWAIPHMGSPKFSQNGSLPKGVSQISLESSYNRFGFHTPGIVQYRGTYPFCYINLSGVKERGTFTWGGLLSLR